MTALLAVAVAATMLAIPAPPAVAETASLNITWQGGGAVKGSTIAKATVTPAEWRVGDTITVTVKPSMPSPIKWCTNSYGDYEIQSGITSISMWGYFASEPLSYSPTVKPYDIMVKSWDMGTVRNGGWHVTWTSQKNLKRTKAATPQFGTLSGTFTAKYKAIYPSSQYRPSITIEATERPDCDYSHRETTTSTATFPLAGQAPTARFTYKIDPDGRTVSFTNQSTDPQQASSSLKSRWDFGDKKASTTRSPIHRYTSAGTKTVTLTVTDSAGNVGTVIKKIELKTAGLVVNSTGDRQARAGGRDGCDTGKTVHGQTECTLRAAIEAANRTGGGKITFAIPGTKTPTIKIGTALPRITKKVHVAGTSQPGRRVAVAGANIDQYALRFTAAKSRVDGLIVNGFTLGIGVANAPGTVITDNRIGVSASGATDSDMTTGIGIAGSGVTVKDNVIGGETGIFTFPGSDKITITGNLIGVARKSGGVLGSMGTGVILDATHSSVTGNTIAAKQYGVVTLTDSKGAVISGNSIGVARGKDLGVSGVGIRIDGTPAVTATKNTIIAHGPAAIQMSGTKHYTTTTASDGSARYEFSDDDGSGKTTGVGGVIKANTIGLAGGKVAGERVNTGIDVFGGARKARIVGNTVAHGNIAISLDGGSGHTVTGNKLGLSSAKAVSIGIEATGVTDLTVGGTKGSGNTIFADLQAADLTVTGGMLVIQGNSARAPTGVKIAGKPAETRVERNTITQTGSARAAGTIGLDLAARPSKATVTSNVVTGFAIGVAVEGSGAQLTGNTVIRAAKGMTVSGKGMLVEGNSLGQKKGATNAGLTGDALTITSGTAEVRSNTIAGSTHGRGVVVDQASAAWLKSNRIFGATNGAIAVATIGAPKSPRIAGAVIGDSGKTTRTYLLVTGLPKTGVGTIEVFANKSCTAPNDQAYTVLRQVRQVKSGDESRLVVIKGKHNFFTVTYTDAKHRTSELSNCAKRKEFPDTDGDGSPDVFESAGTRDDPTKAVIGTDEEQLILVTVVKSKTSVGGTLTKTGPVDAPKVGSRSLPFGALSFRITLPKNAKKSTRTLVAITQLTGDSPPTGSKFFIYGSAKPGARDSWYRFVGDATTKTGSSSERTLLPTGEYRTTFLLKLGDGVRGDDDGAANGTITLTGGPAR